MTESPPKKRKRRLWLKVLLAVVVLLVLLVLLAPTLLSTGPARSYVMGKANQYLNGHAQVDDWSLGWTSGITINALKVFDEKNSLVLECRRIHSPLSLIAALRGDYDLGQVAVDDLNVARLEVDPQGGTNLQRLWKSQPAGPPPAATKEEAKTTTSGSSVRGTITINNLRGTIVGPTFPQAVTVEPSKIEVKIKSINDPIDNAIKLVLRAGEGAPGTLTLTGSIDIHKRTVSQAIQFQGFDLKAANPFLKLAKVPVELGGIADGSLDGKLGGVEQISAEGNVQVVEMIMSGDILNGDRIVSRSLRMPIKVVRKADYNGMARLQVDTAITIDHGTIAVKADGREDALIGAIKLIPQAIKIAMVGKKEAQELVAFNDGDGQATVEFNLDGAAVVKALPRTLKLKPDTTIQAGTGQVSGNAVIELKSGCAVISGRIDQRQMVVQSEGRTVTLDPVLVKAGATVTAGAAVDLRDVAVNMTSDFAKIDVIAKTLWQPHVTGEFDLTKLSRQLAAVRDMGRVRLAGTGSLTIDSDGQWGEAGSKIQLRSTVACSDLEIGGIGNLKPIRLNRLIAKASAQVEQGQKSPIGAIRDLVLSLQAGDEISPTVHLEASGSMTVKDGKVGTAAVTLTRLDVDLTKAPQAAELLMNVLAKKKFAITGGMLSATGTMEYDNGVVTVDVRNPLRVTPSNLTVHRDGQVVVQNYGLKLIVAGTFTETTKGVYDCRVRLLSLSDTPRWISLSKSGETDLTGHFESGGSVAVAGKLDLSADARALIDLLPAITGNTELAAKFKDLGSAAIEGTVAVGNPAAKQNHVTADLAISRLSYGRGIQNQSVVLNAVVDAPEDFSTVSIPRLDLSSDLVTLKATQPILLKTGGSIFEMVRKAGLEVSIPKLPEVIAIIRPFLAMAPQAASVAPGQLPGLDVAKGSLHLAASIQRQGNATFIRVRDLSSTDLTLNRGDSVVYASAPVTFTLDATLNTAGAKINRIQVANLDGQLGFARIRKGEGSIIVRLDKDKPIVDGYLKVTGRLNPTFALLNALQGQQRQQQYDGDYELVQKFMMLQDQINFDGTLQVADLRVLDQGKVVFTESQMDLANQLTVNTRTKSLAIKALSLKMKSTNALGLAVSGSLVDWEKTRHLSKIKLDLDYDLEGLRTVLTPRLDPALVESLKEVQIAGRFRKTFTLNGSLPADKPFTEAVKQVRLSGDLAVGRLAYMGHEIKDLDVPVFVHDGLVETIYADRAAAAPRRATLAKYNGGTLNLNGLKLDLTTSPPRLTIPANHALLQNVSINQRFGNDILGAITPFLIGAKGVSGQATVTVLKCSRLPLNATLFDSQKPQDGDLQLTLGVNNVNVDGGAVTEAVLGRLQQGQINGRLTVSQGQVSQDMSIYVGGVAVPAAPAAPAAPNVAAQQARALAAAKLARTIRSTGSVNLVNRRIEVTSSVPKGLFRSSLFGQIKFVGDVLKQLPDRIVVPIKGTLDKVEVDAGGAIMKSLNLGGLEDLGNLLKGKQPDQPPQNQQPKKRNPLDDLIDLIPKKK